MTLDQNIFLDIATQSVFIDVWEGQPSAVASVTIFDEGIGDEGTQENAKTGTAAIDSLAQLLTGSAGPSHADPKNLPLITSSVVAGRRYILVGDDGGQEEVYVNSKESATASLRYPLLRDYDTGAELRGARITQGLLDSWVADSNNLGRYRVRWVFTVNGLQVVRDTYFELTRYAGDYSVTAEDVEARMSGWRDALPVHERADAGRGKILAAYRDVILDLRNNDIDDEEVRDPELTDRLVVQRVIANRADDQAIAGELPLEIAIYANEKYDRIIERHIRDRGDARVDHNDSGGGAPAGRRRVFIR